MCVVCDRVRPTSADVLRIVGGHDLSHYTAMQIAMVRLSCEPFQLKCSMCAAPADIEAHWEGSDAGSHPTMHLVVTELPKTKPPKKLARSKSK